MNDNNPKLETPVDISEIKRSAGSNSRLVPTVIIRSEGSGAEGQNQEGSRVKLLEKIVKTEILLNVLLVLILVVSLYVGFVLRFDIQKYLNKASVGGIQPGEVKNKTGNTDLNFRVVAAEKELQAEEEAASVYITKHGVNLNDILEATPSGKLTAHGQFKNEIMGFLPYWAVANIDQIDTRAITSISYFGLEVDGGGEVIKYDTNKRPIEAWTYLQKDKGLDKLIKKVKNNKLKLYLTLKAFNQSNIVALTTSQKARDQFIVSALYLMSSKSFDGLNIDFEYIGTPDKKVRDGFSALIIDLNKAMKAQYPDSVLTIDTFIDAASATRIHDIPVLSQNSDGLVIMGYDFHTPNSSRPGPIAPMEGSGLSIKGLMASYLDKAPADKLILAVPYYGYDWPVRQQGKGYEVSGVRQDVNVLAYAEIADATKNSKILWDENAQVPWYSYLDPQTKVSRVVYFENVRSLGIKYDYVKANKLQGVAIWALGFDGKRAELGQTLIDKFAQ